MKHKLFTVYDSAAKAYLPPFCLPEEGMALRTFKDCVNEPTHAFSKNPADYTLFNLGAYDDNTAEITTNKRTIKLANGLELQDPAPGLPGADAPNLKSVGE